MDVTKIRSCVALAQRFACCESARMSMFGPTRGGTRGGAAEFKWTDVAADKDRENYLGHSIQAPVGRWQKNKDVNWYNKDSGPSTQAEVDAANAAEIRRIKRAEEDALSLALGFKPTLREPTPDPEEEVRQLQAKIEEKAERRALRRIEKEEKKAAKEAKRKEKEERRVNRRPRSHHSRSGSPERSRPRSRSLSPQRDRRREINGRGQDPPRRGREDGFEFRRRSYSPEERETRRR